jgi:hypothetical protein
MQCAGVDLEHLTCRYDEIREPAVIVENRNEGGPGDAVGELVGVGVPVWRAHRARGEQHPFDGQPLEDRQIVCGDAAHRAEVVLLDDLAVVQGGGVVAAGE